MKIVEFPQLELLAIEIFAIQLVIFFFFFLIIAIPHPHPHPHPFPHPWCYPYPRFSNAGGFWNGELFVL